MPSADNTPDFDSMSPEELMAWMESLAERQGATEGFTTDTRMEIGEIDPDSVDLDEPGYIPYGMDPEKWKEMQAEEAAQKAAKKAAAVPPPAPVPTPAEVVPTPEPVAEAPPTATDSGTPDFDSMSPEEMMAWMESLAVRQGAQEGLIVPEDQRVEVAEIDPDSVALDEPGYIPYGMDEEKWKAMQAEEAAQKAAKKAAAAPPPAPEPEVVVEPEPELFSGIPDFALPTLEIDEDETEVAPAIMETDGEDALAWLESLAADQADIPDMDLSALSAEIEPLNAPLEAMDTENPLTWLESLAQGDAAISPTADELETDEAEMVTDEPAPSVSRPPVGDVVDPVESGVNTVEWLESLARRQGVSPDELVTSADMEIPIPGEAAKPGPGYTDYTFEAAPEEDKLPDVLSELPLDIDEPEDPEAWLEELAASHHGERGEHAPAGIPDLFGDDMPEDEDLDSEEAEAVGEDNIIAALNAGQDVSAEDMQAWMENQFDIAEEIGDDVPEVDPDAPPIKADLPDWLLEQMGTPPVLEDEEEAPPKVQTVRIPGDAPIPDFLQDEEDIDLPDEIVETPVEEMPDWLQAETVPEEPETAMDAIDLGIDELAAEPATDDMPDWLTVDVDEPETELELPEGLTAEPEDGPVLFDPKSFGMDDESATEMPDWLKEEAIAGADDDVDMPDWLQAEVTDDAAEDAESIFADESPAEAASVTADAIADAEVEIDTSDPWAEAFELERTEGMADIDTVPDWYAERIAEGGEPVSEAAPVAKVDLVEAELEPETELTAGEVEELPDWLKEAVGEGESADELVPVDVPDWLSESIPSTDEVPAVVDELPDWLAGTEDSDAVVDVPDWLKDTLKTDEQEAIHPAEEAKAVTEPVQASPVPVPAAAQIDVAATLQEARSKVQSGAIDDSLLEYERVVRANAQLDAVADDLNKLLKDKKHKENPAVHRVLGDTLMRKGDLQAALDTYRKALNLL